MPGKTEALAALHQLYIHLEEVTEQLEKGPRQLRARDRKVEQAKQALAELEEKLKQARAKADRKALDLKSNEAKIADLKAKLNVANSNKEFDIIKGQIEADTVANSVLEDEILESLETIDSLQCQIGQQKEEISSLQAARDRFAAEFEQTAKTLKAEESRLREEIVAAEKFLTGDNLLRYRRLTDAHGAGGLAMVDQSGVCSNCFVALTSQAKVQVQAGEIYFCGSCGRLLYYVAD